MKRYEIFDPRYGVVWSSTRFKCRARWLTRRPKHRDLDYARQGEGF